VDAAQSSGVIEIDVEEQGITILCASSHKGLMGPPGAGLLYVSPEVEIEPLVAGGTGSASEDLEMPGAYPDHLEAGTLPGPAIAGLAAGIEWVKAQGLAKIRNHKDALCDSFLDWAEKNEAIKVYGGRRTSGALRTGVISFSLNGVAPAVVADELDRRWGVAVRAGLHCAALAHHSLGTLSDGLVRVSFGCFNSQADVERLTKALESLSRTVSGISS